LGPTGDDDNDRALNFYEYATGGNPTNALDRGFVPTARVQIEGGTNWLEYIYVRRSASTSGMVCHPELSDNLVLNVWTNAGYTVVGSGPFTNGFEAVTNRILTEIKTHQFIRLHVEGLP
jgi:hypothetical protein